jgi:hypothetical protein
MSTRAAAVTILAVLLAALPAAYWLLLHWRRVEADCDRILRSVQHDTSPDPLRLLDAHLDTYSASVRCFYDDSLLVLTGPELDAGRDRLRTAIHDHRKEDTP